MNEAAARTAFFKALMRTDVRRGNGKQEDAELEAALTAAFAILAGPEPTYEYRVVCNDDGWIGSASSFEEAVEKTRRTEHVFRVERRRVGPWGAT